MKLKSRILFFVCLILISTFSSIGFATLSANYRLIGDVDFNGVISIKDATCIQKHIALIETINDSESAYADVIQDGRITIKDATAIQKHLVGLIKLPDINNHEPTSANNSLPLESTSELSTLVKSEPTATNQTHTTTSSFTETQSCSTEPTENTFSSHFHTADSTTTLPTSTSIADTSYAETYATEPTEISSCYSTAQTNPPIITQPTVNNGIELPDHDWD